MGCLSSGSVSWMRLALSIAAVGWAHLGSAATPAMPCPNGYQVYDEQTCIDADGVRLHYVISESRWLHGFSKFFRHVNGMTLVEEDNDSWRQWVKDTDLAIVSSPSLPGAGDVAAQPVPLENKVMHACAQGYTPYQAKACVDQTGNQRFVYGAKDGRAYAVVRSQDNDYLVVDGSGQRWIRFESLALTTAYVPSPASVGTVYACPSGWWGYGQKTCVNAQGVCWAYYVPNAVWVKAGETQKDQLLLNDEATHSSWWTDAHLLMTLQSAAGMPPMPATIQPRCQ